MVLRCWCERLGWNVIIAAASLLTSVPVPIAIPMSAFFTAGASLTPLPSIAGLALLPQDVDQAHFVLGGDLGDHAEVVDPGRCLLVGHAPDSAPVITI